MLLYFSHSYVGGNHGFSKGSSAIGMDTLIEGPTFGEPERIDTTLDGLVFKTPQARFRGMWSPRHLIANEES
jgi:hypothetical protein